jgi:hypothetical protein
MGMGAAVRCDSETVSDSDPDSESESKSTTSLSGRAGPGRGISRFSRNTPLSLCPPHLVTSIVFLRARESGVFVFFLFFFASSFVLMSSMVGGRGRSGRIFMGRRRRPEGVTVHPLRSGAFSAVTRDMSSASTPVNLLCLRFFAGGGSSAASLRSFASLQV